MDSDNSLLNTNNLIPFSIIEKLTNSIACVMSNDIGTGFFIKLELNERITPYFCTAFHVIEDILNENQNLKEEKKDEGNDKKISLILNKKDEDNNKIIINLSCDKTKKDIIFYKYNIDIDIAFIELLKEEIEDISISYLELEEEYLNNPIKYFDLEVITAAYPNSYFKDPLKDWPLLSYGNILKIKNNSIIVYNMETDRGSSGSPICIINKKNELKLIGIHTRHNGEERLNYNEGTLFGPILRYILNEDDVIEVNNDDDVDKIQNIIKNISDKFDDLINIEKKKIEEEKRKKEEEEEEEEEKIDFNQIEEVKNNGLNINTFKPVIYYNNILFYKNAIDEECKKINKSRFKIYYNLISNHILTRAFNLFEENKNKILTILNYFENHSSTYQRIKEFNEDIINCFNRILLSEDYDLKSKLIYFIAAYKDALNKMNCRYKYKNFNLYHREIMNGEIIKNIIEHKDKIVAFKYFIDKLIPETFFNKFYQKYADIKSSFHKEYRKLLKQIKNSDYDTRIYIEYNNNHLDSINCFKISNSEIVIEPFTLFKIKNESKMNHEEQTADIYLQLLSEDPNLNNYIEILP